MKTRNLRFTASTSVGEVSAVLVYPEKPAWLMVLAHGAGGGIHTSFMEKISRELGANAVATFRYNFPYMERGKKTPDPKPIAISTVRAAIDCALNALPNVPLLAGGKSYGGRMTSTAESQSRLRDTQGLVFFGFPLHPPGKPSVERAEHLLAVSIPMLFLQGSRDAFAELNLLQQVYKRLNKSSQLYIVEGADHSFHLPKNQRKTDDEVIKELASKSREWADSLRGK